MNISLPPKRKLVREWRAIPVTRQFPACFILMLVGGYIAKFGWTWDMVIGGFIFVAIGFGLLVLALTGAKEDNEDNPA